MNTPQPRETRAEVMTRVGCEIGPKLQELVLSEVAVVLGALAAQALRHLSPEQTMTWLKTFFDCAGIENGSEH